MTASDSPAPTPAPPPPAPPEPMGACGNCGTPLLGPHCYACGQPVKGLVRHFGSIVGDFFDSVFELDSRTPRTLWPLFVKPGYLALEYFAGRRVRYVSPFRLFFFLAIITFFFARLTTTFGDGTVSLGGDTDAIARANTVAEVEELRDQALADLEEAKAELRKAAPGADAGMIPAETAVRGRAANRIAELRKAEADGRPPPVSDDMPEINLGNGPWHPETNPVAVAWLPGFANDWINTQVGRTRKNITRLRDDPDLFKDAMLGAVPTTLIVLLPLFALMLKVVYLFKRRLYTEHLIVALHSHAFLCLALLLLFIALALQRWLAPDPGWLKSAFGWAEAALWVWMPLYLLLMQKRVYGQGWPMTLLKYSVIGICYIVLLSIGALFVTLGSLVWL